MLTVTCGICERAMRPDTDYTGTGTAYRCDTYYCDQTASIIVSDDAPAVIEHDLGLLQSGRRLITIRPNIQP